MEVRKAVDRDSAYRFFRFFLGIDIVEFRDLFYLKSLPRGYFGGCSISAPHIWCTEMVMYMSYHLIFLTDLSDNLVMINSIQATLAEYCCIKVTWWMIPELGGTISSLLWVLDFDCQLKILSC